MTQTAPIDGSSHQISVRRGRRGYLLLTVLVLIAMSMLIMGRMASTSMRVAATATAQERDLRNRWAVTTMRRYCMRNAQSLVNRSARRLGSDDSAGTATAWRDLDLAGQRWRVIVADENGKIHLPHAIGALGVEQTRGLAEQILGGGEDAVLRSPLQPAYGTSSQRWDQWLDASGTQDRPARALASATRNLTLWGNGELNLATADRISVQSLWKILFGRQPPAEFEALRQQRPTPPLSQFFGAAGLRDSQIAVAEEWFGTESQCHSIWIFCQTDRRVSPTLFVQWGAEGSATEHRGYQY